MKFSTFFPFFLFTFFIYSFTLCFHFAVQSRENSLKSSPILFDKYLQKLFTNPLFFYTEKLFYRIHQQSSSASRYFINNIQKHGKSFFIFCFVCSLNCLIPLRPPLLFLLFISTMNANHALSKFSKLFASNWIQFAHNVVRSCALRQTSFQLWITSSCGI